MPLPNRSHLLPSGHASPQQVPPSPGPRDPALPKPKQSQPEYRTPGSTTAGQSSEVCSSEPHFCELQNDAIVPLRCHARSLYLQCPGASRNHGRPLSQHLKLCRHWAGSQRLWCCAAPTQDQALREEAQKGRSFGTCLSPQPAVRQKHQG